MLRRRQLDNDDIAEGLASSAGSSRAGTHDPAGPDDQRGLRTELLGHVTDRRSNRGVASMICLGIIATLPASAAPGGSGLSWSLSFLAVARRHALLDEEVLLEDLPAA